MNLHGLIWCKKCVAIVGCCHNSPAGPAIYVYGPNAAGGRTCDHQREKDWVMNVVPAAAPPPERN